MPQRQLKQIRAIITGASSGIGRALAVALAAEQAQLVLIARREERLRELATEVARQGGTCEIVVGDVTSTEARQACLDRAVSRFDGLDLLINNAGVGASGEFADSNEATLRHIMEVNFFALTELTRICLPQLLTGRAPAIVNIGSIIAHHGLPSMSEYSASKGAVRGFSEALRAELIDRVHVMLVSPATTATEFFDKLPESASDEQFSAQRWRAKRPLAPEAVANATLKGLRRNKREVFPGTAPKLIRLAARFSPRLFDDFVESGERKARRAAGGE